jgi:hypothetical protein
VVERDRSPHTLGDVPGPKPTKLSAAERRRLVAATERIERSSEEWAALVRKLGIAACARELGITPQALSARVTRIEGRR